MLAGLCGIDVLETESPFFSGFDIHKTVHVLCYICIEVVLLALKREEKATLEQFNWLSNMLTFVRFHPQKKTEKTYID